MKRKRLLLTVFFLAAVAVGMMWPLGAMGQTNVTGTYLTNADFSSSSGWTQTASGGSWSFDATNKVAEAYAGWSSCTLTSYSLTQKVTLAKGVYKLTGYAFYRSGAAYSTDPATSLATMFAGSVSREITTLSSPSRDSYPNDVSGAATAFYTDGDYLNTLYFTVDADNTTISIGYQGTHTAVKGWFICGAMKLYKIDIATVSSSAPLDIDVLNSGFDVCLNGWTYTTGATNHGRATNQSGDISGGFFENWQSDSYTGAIQQSQTLPNGTYTVKAAAFRSGLISGASDGDAVYVFANDDKTLVEATTGTYYTASTTVTDESLTYGVRSNVKKYQWMGIDNTSITCTGIQLAYADALPSTDVTAETWYAATISATGNYTISSTAAATLSYTQDGTQTASDVTSSTDAALAAGGSETVSLSTGTIYIKSSAASTITIEAASYSFTAGDDATGLITNPGFENGDATGWTISSNNDTGVYSTSNSTYATVGSTGSYLLNNWWTGTPLTQDIGTLPAGAYLLTADVATGNSASEVGTLYLNANSNYSTGYVSSNNKIFGTERLAFYADGSTDVTIGLRGGENATINADGSVTKGAVNESGYWWYKTDNFTLTYLGHTAEELAIYLSTLAATNAPYSDISADDDLTGYTANYNTYSAYTSSNTIAELVTAINYIANEYDDYCWVNASTTHPVEFTDDIISGADCTSNDSWPGSGRTTATGTYYDGTSRTYFTQNHENGAARSQEVTILYEGAYLLRTIVRPVAAASYATITIADQSTTTSGVQTGDAIIGNGWAYNDVYFFESDINQATTISINLSNVNSSREADCGEMHLYYIGRKVDITKDGVHSYYGNYATAPAIELTDDVPVADVTNATFASGSSTVTFTNPNGLVFVNDDAQTSASKNEVIGTTCATLALEDGHPFINPTSFTATSATYTLSALADDEFATLVLPFAATLPSGGTAYALDQDIDLLDGNVRGTSTSIAANTPVLVTAAGEYTGSGVTVAAVTSGTTYTSGELVGVYQATAAPASSYVLQKHDDRVAFYLVGSAQPTVNPFRAYIQAQSSNVKAINVVFDADGIETLSDEAMKGKVEIFNLAGQRLSQPQRGVNIINGKKVVIK